MFKKTLLALAIAGVSISANAAVVKVGHVVSTEADTVARLLEKTVSGLGTDKVFAGTDNDCKQIATNLGLPIDLNGNVADNKQLDSAVFASVTGTSVGSVKYTGVAACTVTVPDTFKSAVKKDGIEYASIKAIEINPAIVAGIGGYKSEDTFTVKLAGAKIDLTQTVLPTITVGDGGQKGASGTTTFEVLDISADMVRFTVKAGTPATDAIKGGAVLVLGGVFLDSTGLTSSTSVTVESFGTNTSGTKFDEAPAVAITALVPQYKAEVDKLLNGSIDVGKDRQQFAQGDTALNQDTLTLKVSKETTGSELVPDVATYVITGDFTWMSDKKIDVNQDGKLSSDEIKKAVAYSGASDTLTSFALNTDKNELTAKVKVAGALDTAPSFVFTVPGFDQGKLENAMIPVQSFTAKLDVLSDKSVNNKTAPMPALSVTNAGSWELNGSVVVLPYIPFGPNTQPILRHTNAGTRTGDVTVRYMIEGEDVTWKTLSAAKIEDVKPGVRNILSLVTDALKAEGYDADTKGFKAALEVVTNVPSRDIHVFAGAKVTSSDSSRINLTSFKTNNQL